jgi:hypothetical protein
VILCNGQCLKQQVRAQLLGAVADDCGACPARFICRPGHAVPGTVRFYTQHITDAATVTATAAVGAANTELMHS